MDFLASLPNELKVALITGASGAVGGIIGALVTIGVTWINFRHERERLRTQLEHEARERKRERDLQLRRDLLMSAADDALGQMKMLIELADVNTPMTQTATVPPGTFVGLAKAHMVGSLPTIKAFDRIAAVLRDEAFKLMKLRAVFDWSRQEMDRLTQQIEQEQEQVIALQPAGGAPPSLLFTEHRKKLAAVIEKRNELQRSLNTQVGALVAQAMQSSASYSAALADANIEARRELDQAQGFEADEYARHVKASTADNTRVVDELIAELKGGDQ